MNKEIYKHDYEEICKCDKCICYNEPFGTDGLKGFILNDVYYWKEIQRNDYTFIILYFGSFPAMVHPISKHIFRKYFNVI